PHVSGFVPRIDVVRATGLKKGSSTRGVSRAKAFDSANVLVSRSRLAAKAVSDWHHHGARHLYGFLDSGHMRLEDGPHGRKVADVRTGDFLHIPPGMVHLDVNPSRDRAVAVVSVMNVKGHPVINVHAPEGRIVAM